MYQTKDVPEVVRGRMAAISKPIDELQTEIDDFLAAIAASPKEAVESIPSCSAAT